MRSKMLAAAVAAVVVLGGCSSGSDNPEPANSSDTATSTAPKQVQEGSDEQAYFGDTFIYDSGLELTVGTPAEFTPTPLAAGGDDAAQFVQFEVTITNNSRRDFEMGEFYAQLTAGGELAAPVFDADIALEGYPEDPVPTMGSVTFLLGYGVASTTSMTMEITPDLDLGPAVFQSR